MGGGRSEIEVVTTDHLIQTIPKFMIIKGHWKALFMSQEDICNYFQGHCEESFFPAEVYSFEDAVFDFQYYKEHEAEFNEVRNVLADDFSVKSFDAFINSKINQDNDYILPYMIKPRYFFEKSFIKWKPSSEVLVDCGAYNGDTIREFLQAVDYKYEKIYAFEPEENNIKALTEYIQNEKLENVEVIRKGAYNYKGKVSFSGNDQAGHITGESVAENTIKVDTIDNILQGNRATFIKMDVEQSEYMAIEGAKQTIIRERPALGICVYHKKDDIFTIYKLLKPLCNDYKFFFRCHSPMATDAVLYAVPEERVNGTV